MTRKTLLAGAGAGAALACLLLIWSPWRFDPGRSRPNVILISIDTLRPDRMGVYGHRPMGFSTTPFLDELAASGTVFTRAVSTSSWTLPAHYSLFTGVPDDLHGMVEDRMPPPQDIPMLAEILKEAGYATAGFYSGPYLDPFFGFGRGFDVYRSCMDFDTVYQLDDREAQELGPDEIAGRTRAMEQNSHQAITSRAVTGEALHFAKENRGRPYFLFLHYFDVHHDYVPPPPYDERFTPPYRGWVDGRGVMSDARIKPGMAQADLDRLAGLYDGEIGWVDENIGRLFQGLRAIDLEAADNALVVVLSDHGEEFLEHGAAGHRRNLYETAVRIPLIMSWPGRIPAAATATATARIYDVLPTLTDLLGIPAPPIVRGSPLLPLDAAGAGSSRPALMELTAVPGGQGTTFAKHLALEQNGLKLITVQERRWSKEAPLDFTGELLAETHELYDLAGDPGEKHNLLPQRQDLFLEMIRGRDTLMQHLRDVYLEHRVLPGAARTDVPEGLRGIIEGLGY